MKPAGVKAGAYKAKSEYYSTQALRGKAAGQANEKKVAKNMKKSDKAARHAKEEQAIVRANAMNNEFVDLMIGDKAYSMPKAMLQENGPAIYDRLLKSEKGSQLIIPATIAGSLLGTIMLRQVGDIKQANIIADAAKEWD